MPESHPDSRTEKRIRRLEDVYIILSIFTIWPVILRWRHPFFEFAMYVALVGLVVIFFRRIKRFSQSREDLK